MKSVALFETDGGVVSFEAEHAGESFAGVDMNALFPKLHHNAEQKLEDGLAQVGVLAEAVRTAVSRAKLGSVEVSFGLKVSAEGQLIVAKASAEASLTISFTVTPAE